MVLLCASSVSVACFNANLILVSLLYLALVRDGNAHGGDAQDDTLGGKKLLVISLDGYRHDFLELHGSTTLAKLGNEGVRAKSLTSSYVTKTFPNHYSIATGLYEESHGIVANLMWDKDFKEMFDHCSNKSCGKWYGGEPIWNTNERNNNINVKLRNNNGDDNGVLRRRRHANHGITSTPVPLYASGVIYWPGGSAEINNMSITFSEQFVSNKSEGHKTFRQRLDEMLSWFTHSTTPVNLGMLYYEYPDYFCHIFGPESSKVKEVIHSIDDDLAYFLEKLKEKKIFDLNIMIVSDHGFADVDKDFIYLEDCIDSSMYNITSNAPIISIWPNGEADVDELYQNLSRCDGIIVHKKDSFELKEYHYSNNIRISPIILSTPRSADGNSAKLIMQSRVNWTERGEHGWNNTWEKMHALFIAHGPAFKKGYVHEPFENVNIYPLMCKVLGIVCPQTNGSLSAVSDMLYEEASNNMVTMVTLVLIALVCAFVAGIMIVGVCRLGSTSITHNGAIHSRSYRLKVSSKQTPERSTLLASSDDEF